MSDAAVAAVVTGVVTVTTMVVGFLTLWVKLKYGVEITKEASEHAKKVTVKAEESVKKAEESAKKAEESVITVSNKIDRNTELTVEVKEVATKASEHAISCDEEKVRLFNLIHDHESRIASIEAQIVTVKMATEAVSKNLDSTRHEMRGHMQTMANKLDLMFATISGGNNTTRVKDT